tara:strand:- start:147 stop:437 length:291 start_codon:yes stop_codon:yes gene_type:complete
MPPKEFQRKSLRRRGHNLKPIVTVGAGGLTDAVLAELESALNHHELIKIKIRIGSRERRDVVLQEILDRSEAAIIQKIGNVALLYRTAKTKETDPP